MEARLQGKTILVTGCGGLIGPIVVRRLAKEGAAVVVTDLSVEVAETLSGEIIAGGGKACFARLDVSDDAEVAAVIEHVEKTFAPIDVLVNNAGLLRKGCESFQDVDASTWRRIVEVNLFGVMSMCRHTLGRMIGRKSGKIINLASIAGVSGLPGWADYAAAKGGVIAFSQTLAMEAGQFGVTVNCVSPGMIGKETEPNPGTWLERSGQPDDIAGMIAFLASPEADFITGANFLVDGGRVIGPKNARWEPNGKRS